MSIKLKAPKTTFGIELEFGLLNDDDHNYHYYYNKLANIIQDYNMAGRWCLTEDTSVTAGDFGMEIKTVGGHTVTALLKDYKRLAVVLNKWQTQEILKIDQSAGFHIHIGVDAWSVDNLKHFFKIFAQSVREWLQFQPSSRSNNDMCARNNSIDVFESLKHEGRYKALNADALLKHGTLELRIFAGTVRYFKVENTLKLVDRYIQGVLTDSTKMKRRLIDVIDNKKLLRFVLARVKNCNGKNSSVVRMITSEFSEKIAPPRPRPRIPAGSAIADIPF